MLGCWVKTICEQRKVVILHLSLLTMVYRCLDVIQFSNSSRLLFVNSIFNIRREKRNRNERDNHHATIRWHKLYVFNKD